MPIVITNYINLQTLSAMAQSFLLFIPTKVSQVWFPESQRAISTTFLAMCKFIKIILSIIIILILLISAKMCNHDSAIARNALKAAFDAETWFSWWCSGVKRCVLHINNKRSQWFASILPASLQINHIKSNLQVDCCAISWMLYLWFGFYINMLLKL